MGLSKQLKDHQSSYHTDIQGSLGWQPPEVIRGADLDDQSQSKTKKVDIFSMGCVIYYILSLGKHPFGDRVEREVQIIANKFSLKEIKESLIHELRFEAAHLIQHMISNDPSQRLSSKEVLTHVFFWNSDKKLKLIQDVSDKLEFQGKEGSSLIENLDKVGRLFQVMGHCENYWPGVLDDCITTELQKWRKYNLSSLADLMRFIRNKKNHFRELSLEAQKLVGYTNESFFSYFQCKFPSLILAVDAFVKINLQHEQLFKSYYEL